MRKANSLISITVLLLFLIHAIAGALQLMGFLPGGIRILTMVDRLMLTLICVHAVIGLKLMIDAWLVRKKTGVHYQKENRIFWIRRDSGLALILLIAAHVIQFLGKPGEVYRLKDFGLPQLIWMLLFVLALMVHLLANIRPLLISLGIAGGRPFLRDLLWILSLVLVFAGAAFVVYYLRWNVIWKVG